jgi:hypothetical protein
MIFWGWGSEAIRLHRASGIGQCEDGEDNVLGERRPSLATTIEARINS